MENLRGIKMKIKNETRESIGYEISYNGIVICDLADKEKAINLARLIHENREAEDAVVELEEVVRVSGITAYNQLIPHRYAPYIKYERYTIFPMLLLPPITSQ